MKSVGGTLTGISTLIEGMSKLLRAGMFDFSIVDDVAGNSTTV